jgi:ABC-type branched-subunit amino acid transport system permease subunit
LRYSIPHSFRDVEPSALTPELLAQIRLSVLLGYGFALSLLGAGGLASLAAFVIGLVARERIKKSRGRLVGLKTAWWCIVVGGLSAAVLLSLNGRTVLSLRP